MTSDHLVVQWRHVIHAHPIPTWTEPAALAYCAEIASQSHLMVELGTYLGCSAKVMLAANHNLHLWCVDIFTAFAFNHQVTAHFLQPEIQSGRCELITGDSRRAAEMLDHLRGQLDAVWVDDGHATEDVMRDIKCFLPLLRRGGVLFGHDFESHPHNNVALGVIASLPAGSFTFPVPRVWSYTKP